ncbi:hypothetical protein Pmani_036018 [Petrolisthes manimaculis]|uniref:Uncharacterized protein n=1 Tax=Petrolisthes manimaculis TaxID=1843537 RepID=A0AAE1NKG9_9EUCA|nr:hypothetical protein Pmani_036018 [Petrolisthes manimaculis]
MEGGGVCPFTLTRAVLYHTLLTGTVLLVTTTQGILLDVYILANDHTAIINYFWLLPDFLMIFVFVAAMTVGYRNCKAEIKRQTHKRGSKTPNNNDSNDKNNASLIARLGLGFLGPHVTPFYVWLAYSIILVSKIAIIFKSEMPSKVGPTDYLSPQLLKMTIAASAVVFGLLVEGQARVESNGERERYIKSLSHGTALEVLDSVTFLSLLIQSESGLVLPWTLENAIIAFACINFFLPAIALVKLSRSDYGRTPVCIIATIVYKLSHLWLINFTFFVIRIYLWAGLSASVSPFVIKNIYHMFSVMKQTYEDFTQLQPMLRKRLSKRRRVYNSGVEASGSTGAAALNNTSSADWTPNNDKFEEIDLRQDSSPNA